MKKIDNTTMILVAVLLLFMLASLSALSALEKRFPDNAVGSIRQSMAAARRVIVKGVMLTAGLLLARAAVLSSVPGMIVYGIATIALVRSGAWKAGTTAIKAAAAPGDRAKSAHDIERELRGRCAPGWIELRYQLPNGQWAYKCVS